MGNDSICKLKCFKYVGSVIGKSRAEIELFKVVSVGSKCSFNDYPELDGAFVFDDTPQGSNFWLDVMYGINPYDNRTIRNAIHD